MNISPCKIRQVGGIPWAAKFTLFEALKQTFYQNFLVAEKNGHS